MASRSGTDLTIIIAAVASGVVLGSLVGLARAAAMSQDTANVFQKDFVECMAARGYR